MLHVGSLCECWNITSRFVNSAKTTHQTTSYLSLPQQTTIADSQLLSDFCDGHCRMTMASCCMNPGIVGQWTSEGSRMPLDPGWSHSGTWNARPPLLHSELQSPGEPRCVRRSHPIKWGWRINLSEKGVKDNDGFTVTVTNRIPEPGKKPSMSKLCQTGYLPRCESAYRANCVWNQKFTGNCRKIFV
jgi:hypothetical protein